MFLNKTPENGIKINPEFDTLKTNDEFVDSKSAVQFLKCSYRTLQRLRDQGKIPYYQPQRKTLYKISDLREYVSKSLMPAFNAEEGGGTNG